MIDWRHWHNEPYLVGGLVVLGWLWAILAGPLRGSLCARAGVSAPRSVTAHAFRFYGALVIFYLAVGSPLDQVGEGYLLTAHMIQHQLLIYPAAILFLLGIPDWMIDGGLLSRPGPRRLLRFLTRPLIAALVFILVISGWHAPFLYSAALNNKAVHVLEHITFFAAALLYWWPMLSPSRLVPAATHGAQMLFLIGVIIGMMPVHAFITFSKDPLYATYEFAPRLFPALGPKEDQLLAGVLMQIGTIVVGMAAFAVSFYRWYRASERVSAVRPKQPMPV